LIVLNDLSGNGIVRESDAIAVLEVITYAQEWRDRQRVENAVLQGLLRFYSAVRRPDGRVSDADQGRVAVAADDRVWRPANSQRLQIE
jgi:hypothetical protein